ncbi:hypothetical protein AAVH_14671 [Aphelenchoides avenae]|nr:hypothetical protein AAVH_14671 [Aphelenchus avenae]
MFGIGGSAKRNVTAAAVSAKPPMKGVEWIDLVVWAKEKFGCADYGQLSQKLQSGDQRAQLFEWMKDVRLSAGKGKPLGRPTEIKGPADEEPSSEIPEISVARHFEILGQKLTHPKLPVVMCPRIRKMDPSQTPLQMPLEKFRVGFGSEGQRVNFGEAAVPPAQPLQSAAAGIPRTGSGENNKLDVILAEITRVQASLQQLPGNVVEAVAQRERVAYEPMLEGLKNRIAFLESENGRQASDLARIRAEREGLRNKVLVLEGRLRNVEDEIEVQDELLKETLEKTAETDSAPDLSTLEGNITTEEEEELLGGQKKKLDNGDDTKPSTSGSNPDESAKEASKKVIKEGGKQAAPKRVNRNQKDAPDAKRPAK